MRGHPALESSLFQNEVQILNAKPHKYLIGPGNDNVLSPDIADLSDHCPVISLQTLEVHTRTVHTATGFEREVA